MPALNGVINLGIPTAEVKPRRRGVNPRALLGVPPTRGTIGVNDDIFGRVGVTNAVGIEVDVDAAAFGLRGELTYTGFVGVAVAGLGRVSRPLRSGSEISWKLELDALIKFNAV